MFDTITRGPAPITASKRLLTTAVSVLMHLTLLTAVLLVPLWYFTPALPTPSEMLAFVATPPAPAPPPPPPAAAPPARTREPRREPANATPDSQRFAAPVEAPARVEPEKVVETASTAGVLGGVEGGVPSGVAGGIVGGLGSAALPPPPPAPTPVPAPVRIGGAIKAPALVSRVDPEYPAIAQAALLEGIVILEATVDETGRVQGVKVLRSGGPLDGAAIDAVKQWRYSPLKLNGQSTPFVLTVTVQFHLGNRRT
jgi:periplasmic protein TonB